MALLNDDILAARFSTEIQAANAATRRAFNAVLDPLIATVDLGVIRETLMAGALEVFRSASRFQAGKKPATTCLLVFQVDTMFTEAATEHTLYVFNRGTSRLVRVQLGESTVALTDDEEAGLVALLETVPVRRERASAFQRLMMQLQEAFPGAKRRVYLARDFPDYLETTPHVFYGTVRGEADFWHLVVELEMPVMTERVVGRLAEVAIAVSSVTVPAEAEAGSGKLDANTHRNRMPSPPRPP